MSVVESTFVIVEEDIVGLGDSFEFYFGLGSVAFGDFVRVMGKGGLWDLLDQSGFHVCSQGIEGVRKLQECFDPHLVLFTVTGRT
jgi:hypothetical protein